MKFIFTCGGTAGHINPAIAVAGRLKELIDGCEIMFIGAEGKMEMNLVPMEGYLIKALKITNLSRELSFSSIAHNIDTLKNVVVSTHEAKRIIRDFKPDAVIGTGGYVCYPVLKAASELGIPTAVHESNAVPGLTTKLLSEYVNKIMLGFEESKEYYTHQNKVEVVGTPVRGAFSDHTRESARAELGLPADIPLVVSVWGSLGAGHMNGVMAEMIPLMRGQKDFMLLHAAGSKYFGSFIEKLKETAPDHESYGVLIREYIYDMPRVMAAADLILCRAGASTLSELTYMGKPVVIVPSPNVTNNHQEKNARLLEKAGGAKVLTEGSFDAQSLLTLVQELLNDRETLDKMAASMSALANRDSTDKICRIIFDLLR